MKFKVPTLSEGAAITEFSAPLPTFKTAPEFKVDEVAESELLPVARSRVAPFANVREASTLLEPILLELVVTVCEALIVSAPTPFEEPLIDARSVVLSKFSAEVLSIVTVPACEIAPEIIVPLAIVRVADPFKLSVVA